MLNKLTTKHIRKREKGERKKGKKRERKKREKEKKIKERKRRKKEGGNRLERLESYNTPRFTTVKACHTGSLATSGQGQWTHHP